MRGIAVGSVGGRLLPGAAFAAADTASHDRNEVKIQVMRHGKRRAIMTVLPPASTTFPRSAMMLGSNDDRCVANEAQFHLVVRQVDEIQKHEEQRRNQYL
jgi:hypothetical protein